MMQYLFNSALMLACCLCFYKIFLRKETFYQLNRFVLGGCLVLSFGLPLVSLPQRYSMREAQPVAVSSSIAGNDSKQSARQVMSTTSGQDDKQAVSTASVDGSDQEAPSVGVRGGT